MICFGPTNRIQPLFIQNRNPPFLQLQLISVAKEENNNKKKNRKLGSRPSVLVLPKMEPTVAIIADVPSPLILTSGASGRVNALLSLRALKAVVMLLKGLFLLLLLPFRRQPKRCCSGGSSGEKEEKQEVGIRKGAGAGGLVLRVPAAMVGRRGGSGGMDLEIATRRAMAIRRVEQDGDERTVREFAMFATARGETMFTQSWTPATVEIRKHILSLLLFSFSSCFKDNYVFVGFMFLFPGPQYLHARVMFPRGLMVLLHGLNEHSGRYNNFAKELNANGYKVYAMDWVGHGGSDGLHGYVHSLDDAVNDMKAFLEKVLAENPGLPCFFFGHSTGAAIILKAVLDPKIETLIEGMVLTSPAIRVQPSHPIITVLAPIFSFFLPRYKFSGANKQGLPVSRDPEALVAKYSDPLVFTGSIRIRTGYEILCISSYLQRNLHRVNVPFLVLHGTSDSVTDPEASEKLYEEASSSDKSIKLYEGFLHDLLFEPEREEITKDIINWLNSKLKA
ncbi:uncharacterized protein LOC131227237 isoform X1 [Magnolia sinica]|uniref:uncharacterized protein LOC131227237 isoform X1 n=1 Tax=Magnolia sinica TaxID=86752 RepID=UPI00265ACA9A|nr:uncharacterized protein LOC131227237 isoform X1 [Magnolia sinica]